MSQVAEELSAILAKSRSRFKFWVALRALTSGKSASERCCWSRRRSARDSHFGTGCSRSSSQPRPTKSASSIAPSLLLAAHNYGAHVEVLVGGALVVTSPPTRIAPITWRGRPSVRSP